jgi:autotransporter-associated beta strand protein
MKPCKNPFNRIASFGLIAAAISFSSSTLDAATRTKDDNQDALNLTSSWVGGIAPGVGDTALWSGLAGANSVSLGADLSFRGISVGTTGGLVTIQSGNTLTLGASGIDMSAASQDLTISSGLALATGNQNWNVATGRVLTLDTGTFTRAAGSTFNLSGGGTVSASMTGLTNTNSILGPWATVGTGSSTRYATLNGGNITAYTGATASTTFGYVSSPTTNYDVSGIGGPFGSSRSVNTARYTGAAGTLASNSTQTFTFNGLMNAGSGTLTIQTTAGSGNILNLAIGSGNDLVLSAANAGITVNSIISGAAGAGVTVTGPNVVTFAGANTYTGATNINSGSLTLIGNGGVGGGAVRVGSAGTWNIARGLTVNNTVSGAGAINSTNSVVLTGDFSGFTGTFTHNSTTTSLSLNTATSTSKDAAYVVASVQGSSQGMVAAGSGDYTLEMGSLSGVADSLVRGGNVATGTTTLQVGNLGTNTTFAGAISNGVTKTLALNKVGAGSLVLSGTNLYTGATLVSAGTLLVNGSLGNTAVSVTDGTLGGTGTIAGSVTVSGTGTFSPGASIESIATAGLTMGSGTTLIYEAANNGSTGADLVAANGALSLTTVDLDLTGAALELGSWVVGDKLTLISYTGTGITSGFNGFDDDTIYNFGSNQWLFDYNDVVSGENFKSEALGTSFVTLTVVPEPSAALLGGLGLLGLLRRKRR